MSSIYSDIRAALETEVSTISGLPEVFYENVVNNPTTGTSFVRTQFVPASRRFDTLGVGGRQVYKGAMKVFCYAPEGTGPKAADDIANLVLNAFPPGTDLSANGSYLTVAYSERMPGVQQTPWYYIAVDIGWYAYHV